MKTCVEMVREFHNLFDVPVLETAVIPAENRVALRRSLITEEFNELMKAMDENNLVEIADAICDLHYVLSGTALEFGINEDACLAEVHRSNMSKACEDGTVLRREDGKILKAPTYSPANLEPLLKVQL